MLQSVGSQRVRHDLVTEQQQQKQWSEVITQHLVKRVEGVSRARWWRVTAADGVRRGWRELGGEEACRLLLEHSSTSAKTAVYPCFKKLSAQTCRKPAVKAPCRTSQTAFT